MIYNLTCINDDCDLSFKTITSKNNKERCKECKRKLKVLGHKASQGAQGGNYK